MYARLASYARALVFIFAIIVSTLTMAVITMPILYPCSFLFDRQRHSLHAMAGFLWGWGIKILSPWWSFHICGKNYLAKKGEAVIYVANHQSMTDAIPLYILNTRFRWLGKKSLFSIPIYGWLLYLIGYIGIERGDKDSAKGSMAKCAQFLKNGVPILFFPEGTRSADGRLKTFKPGAFRLSKETGVPIVPITISGCFRMLPKGSLIPQKADMYITIHPCLNPHDYSDLDSFIKETKTCIASALPDSEK